jgi:hypothetical protein
MLQYAANGATGFGVEPKKMLESNTKLQWCSCLFFLWFDQMSYWVMTAKFCPCWCCKLCKHLFNDRDASSSPQAFLAQWCPYMHLNSPPNCSNLNHECQKQNRFSVNLNNWLIPIASFCSTFGQWTSEALLLLRTLRGEVEPNDTDAGPTWY